MALSVYKITDRKLYICVFLWPCIQWIHKLSLPLNIQFYVNKFTRRYNFELPTYPWTALKLRLKTWHCSTTCWFNVLPSATLEMLNIVWVYFKSSYIIACFRVICKLIFHMSLTRLKCVSDLKGECVSRKLMTMHYDDDGDEHSPLIHFSWDHHYTLIFRCNTSVNAI